MFRIKREKLLLISCFFGGQVRNIYPALPGHRCIFFSNLLLHRKLALRRGWQFRLVNSLPPSTDYRQCSIYAKYIKFLQFFREFPDLASYERIIYFDHTIYFRPSDLAWMEARHSTDFPLLILRHITTDRTLQGEIEAALSQDRYALTMPETIRWLDQLQAQSSVRLDAAVDATTIISYRQPERVRSLLDEVYAQTLKLGQPECQIIWSALAQLHPDAVLRYDWKELDPLWRVPFQSRREKMAHIGHRLRKLLCQHLPCRPLAPSAC